MSVDLSARLDLRRRARRRSRWRRVLVGVGVLAGIVAAVWLVGFSSVLETRDVTLPERAAESAFMMASKDSHVTSPPAQISMTSFPV